MIRRLREHVAYRNRFATVFDDDVEFPDGAPGTYLRVRVGSGHPGVVVLPIRDGAVGLVSQYRYPVSADMWELPRGGADSADSAAEAARELWEETGAADVDLIELGRTHPDSGCLETTVVLFAAVLPAGCPFEAVDEVDGARWVPVAQLWDEVARGEITDGFTLAALTYAVVRGVLPGPVTAA